MTVCIVWALASTMHAHPAEHCPHLRACEFTCWCSGGRRPCCLRSQIEPKGDRVLVKVADQEEKTRGGILLPVSAQKRPTSGEEHQQRQIA